MKMRKTMLKVLIAGIITTGITSCDAMRKCFKGKSKNETSCNHSEKSSCGSSCSSTSKNKKMENKNETCDKCGKSSCDKDCSSQNSSSINGITDDVCTTKSMKQIEAEAEAFKKMDAFKKISSVKELETGYEFVYDNPSEKLKMELIDFVKLEIKCCPTYDYALIIDSKTNTFHYQRFGSPKIKAELKEYFAMIGLLK